MVRISSVEHYDGKGSVGFVLAFVILFDHFVQTVLSCRMCRYYHVLARWLSGSFNPTATCSVTFNGPQSRIVPKEG